MAAVVPWPVPGSSQRLAGQPMRFLSAAMAEEESEQAGLCKHFSIFLPPFAAYILITTFILPHKRTIVYLSNTFFFEIHVTLVFCNHGTL